MYSLAVHCERPKDGLNTVKVDETLNMTHSDVYVYTCLPGYATDDDVLTLCRADGSLSLESPPNCSGNAYVQHSLLNIL